MWVAYLAFGVTALGSVMYLWKRTRSLTWDRVAGASAEIGVVFTAVGLVTGMIWGHPTWGVYWTWDARLTTTSLLFVLYLGYLALRRMPAEPHVRAKRAAILGIIAFIDVPIVHHSVEWWRTLHQDATVLRRDLDVQIDGIMLFTLVPRASSCSRRSTRGCWCTASVSQCSRTRSTSTVSSSRSRSDTPKGWRRHDRRRMDPRRPGPSCSAASVRTRCASSRGAARSQSSCPMRTRRGPDATHRARRGRRVSRPHTRSHPHAAARSA